MTERDGSWVEEAMMVVLVLVLGVQRVHGAVSALDVGVMNQQPRLHSTPQSHPQLSRP